MTAEERFYKNIKLAYYWLNKSTVTIPGYDKEDLLQVALMGLWKACCNYDPSRSRFSTFAMSCIKNEVLSQKRRHKVPPTVSLNNVLHDCDGNVEYIETFSNDSTLENSIDKVYLSQADLPKDVRAILSLREYMTQAEVAELLGKYKHYVGKLHKSVRAKLADEGE